MIVLDTSAVVDCITGKRASYSRLLSLMEGERHLMLPSVALFEWLRGPRNEQEIETQELLFPSSLALYFGPQEAKVAAEIYRAVPRARGRQLDIAIAATAISHRAFLWTLNREDFEDIPGLKLVDP
ncbi:MAG: type II toxin-antitoxin system VapC family toxin [Bryobacteraceae bacterium]|nr:type II toxin-antitoxin system VapC family toxin [Bryobacteraceae bacterium]